MAISFPGSPSTVYGSSSLAFTYPALTKNDGLLIIVGQKPTAANGGALTVPSGFTQVGFLQAAGGYGATLGVDTGNCNIYALAKDEVLGTESGSLNIALTGSDTAWGTMIRVAADGKGIEFAAVTGQDTSAGNVSIVFGSDPGVIAGDAFVAAMCIPTDVTTPSQFSAHAVTQSGVTFGAITEIVEPDSSAGNDIGGYVIRANVTAGPSAGAPTITATAGGTTTNVRGPGIFVRIREFIRGEVVATETVDAGAMTGDVIVLGAVDATEALDTGAMTVDIIIGGAMAATEATDIFAFVGEVEVVPPVQVAAPIGDLPIAAALLPPEVTVSVFIELQDDAVVDVGCLVILKPFTQEAAA